MIRELYSLAIYPYRVFCGTRFSCDSDSRNFKLAYGSGVVYTFHPFYNRLKVLAVYSGVVFFYKFIWDGIYLMDLLYNMWRIVPTSICNSGRKVGHLNRSC